MTVTIKGFGEPRGRTVFTGTPRLAAQQESTFSLTIDLKKGEVSLEKNIHSMVASASFKGLSSKMIHTTGSTFMTTGSNRRQYLSHGLAFDEPGNMDTEPDKEPDKEPDVKDEGDERDKKVVGGSRKKK